MADDERGAVGQLGTLALGTILNDLGVETDDSAAARALGSNTQGGPALERDQIYSEKYVDDDFGNDGREDYESQVDKDIEGEESERREREGRFLRAGLASVEGAGRVRGEEQDYDDEDEEDQQQQQQAHSTPIMVKQEQHDSPPPEAYRPPPMRDVNDVYPDWTPNAVLNFTEIYNDYPPRKRARFFGRMTKARAPEKPVVELPSTRELVLQRDSAPPRQSYVRQLAASFLGSSETDDADAKDQPESDLALQLMDVDDWESRIVYAAEQAQLGPPTRPDRPINHDLLSGSWVEGIIWEQGAPHRDFARLLLDMNDPEMMLEREDDGKENTSLLVRSDATIMAGRRAAAELDPFNLSNDHFYEVSREHRQRVRQTLGQLVIQHAPPAIKLQMPFYKTRINKHEARSFHRPAMQFPSNIPLRFSKVRSSKKKKDERGGGKAGSKAKDPQEALKSTRDLTLKDTSQFVMYEYSEEYPPILSKLGMGSLIVNYYRKKDAKDEFVPKLDLGEPFILDVPDESPFMKFGSVQPGETVPTLYNNMIRAPLFRHKPNGTDFLLIRSTTKNEINYYLREIKNIFVVGQTYPLVQVPGPHARLVTNAIKTRLQMIAYKLIETNPGNRIQLHRIMRYFPDQNELQMRQRLKEFMAYNRTAGDVDQGYWKLKPHTVPPEQTELQKLLPPEHMALCEAMQTGQRHLLDAGYTKSAEGADEDGDESKMDIEQLLAPWITSKNFLHATQGKAMLKLHGEGDPSGRGEAFSFLRVSMKEVFYRANETLEERMAAQAEEERKSGHKYNVARQQAIYRSEIQRIWDVQAASLSNPVAPELTAEDERNLEAVEQSRAPTPGPSGNGWDAVLPSKNRAGSLRRDASVGASSRAGGEDENESQNGEKQVLKIRRLIGGKWQTELVRDPGVIGAYIRHRQQIADEAITTEALVPTDDAALNAARRKRLYDELQARKKNQERRLQRKNAKAAAEGRDIPGGYKKLLNKTDTKRVCGRCKQVGHMSTNTSCPLYEAPRPTTMASSASSQQAAGKSAGMAPALFGVAHSLGGPAWGASAAAGPSSAPAVGMPPPTPVASASSPPAVPASAEGTPGPAPKLKIKLGKKPANGGGGA